MRITSPVRLGLYLATQPGGALRKKNNVGGRKGRGSQIPFVYQDTRPGNEAPSPDLEDDAMLLGVDMTDLKLSSVLYVCSASYLLATSGIHWALIRCCYVFR